MVTYHCTHCTLIARMSAMGWLAHRLENLSTHRGPSKYSNVAPKELK